MSCLAQGQADLELAPPPAIAFAPRGAVAPAGLIEGVGIGTGGNQIGDRVCLRVGFLMIGIGCVMQRFGAATISSSLI